MFKLVCLILAYMLIMPVAGVAGGSGGAAASVQSSFRLQAVTMGAAGSPCGGEGKQANGTLSQPTPIGVGSASDKSLYAGFWPRPWSLASVDGRVAAAAMADRLYQNSPNPFRSHTQAVFDKFSQSKALAAFEA